MADKFSRMKQINDLTNFMDSKQEQLSELLSKIGWTYESLNKEKNVQCPFDAGHWVSESSLKRHADICSWIKAGYSKEEAEKVTLSSHFFYHDSTTVVPVLIDKDLLTKILSEAGEGSEQVTSLREIKEMPKTMDRYIVELTPPERLAIYDYVVNKGKATNKPTDVTVEDLLFNFEKKDDHDKPKTHLEILAEQRDYKRRRQSYRAKNVHITKKSYTEEIKEVIENRTAYLAETRKQEEEPDSDRVEKSDEDISKYNSFSCEQSIKHEKEQVELDFSDFSRSHTHKSRDRNSRDRSPDGHRHHKRRHSRSRSRDRVKHKKSHHKKHKK